MQPVAIKPGPSLLPRNEQEAESRLIESTTDWHVNVDDPDRSVIYPGPRRVPGELSRFVAELAKAIDTAPRKNPEYTFNVKCAGYSFRVQQVRPELFAARWSSTAPWPLESLKFPSVYLELLMDKHIKTGGGLVLIIGPGGAGKTTTLASTVAARLKQYGGHCHTIEDPIEYVLDGWHGEHGWCEQVEVADGNFARAIVRALRAFPARTRGMLVLGEVRDPQGATELLRASAQGHLVYSTAHASDIVAGLVRIVSMAREAVGEREALSLLAENLRYVFLQKLDNGVPQMSALAVNDQVRAKILNAPLPGLKLDIEQFQMSLLSSNQRRS
jgi:twitching motility protein PilT